MEEECNSLFLLFERSQATQFGLRKRKAPERRRTELNGVNGDHVCGKVFRPPLSAPQLSRALRREQQRATYPNAKHRRKHLREFARQRTKYTQSSIHIALSRPEPLEKSVQGRCRAVCPAQGVQGGDEIHPCASHGCECLSSQKRLLRGGYYAARSRTQGRGG